MQDKQVPAMYIVHIKQKVDFISKPDQDSQRIKYIYKYINFTALYKTGLSGFNGYFENYEKNCQYIHVYPKCY